MPRRRCVTIGYLEIDVPQGGRSIAPEALFDTLHAGAHFVELRFGWAPMDPERRAWS
jgi:hypothetical protein